MTPLLFAIDYNETWDRDPEMFRDLATVLTDAGHGVIVVTRAPSLRPEQLATIPREIDIVYCPGEFKQESCIRQGFYVSIWIDDNPKGISEGVSRERIKTTL